MASQLEALSAVATQILAMPVLYKNEILDEFDGDCLFVAEAAEVVSTSVGTSVATNLTELIIVCSQKHPEISRTW